jgi:virginiamycin A acetyltransferase
MQICQGGAMKRALIEFCYRRRSLHWCSRLLIRYLDGGEVRSQLLRELLARYQRVEVGAYSYGPILRWGRLPRGSRVGSWCSIGRDFLVRRRNHPIDRITQHPFFYSAKLGVLATDSIEQLTDNPLEIGHDVWIGDRVMILGGCRSIGNGAIIAAGAVVTADVAPYMIVGGIPAKAIRSRFPAEIQHYLELSRWWEFDLTTLTKLQAMLLEPLTEPLAAEFAQRCEALRDDVVGSKASDSKR